MITVLVEAGRARARAALEALVRSRRGLRLLEAPVAATLAEHVRELEPDVLLLDGAAGPERDRPDGPGHDGGAGAGAAQRELDAAMRGLEALPRPPAVVLLTRARARAPSTAALRAGVRAILPREATGAQILAAVEAAAAGLVALRPEAVPALRARARTRGGAAPAGTRGHDAAPGHGERDRPLTARETEILAMMAEGLGNKLIAARLGISRHTAKFHVAAILDKLGAGSRTEAVTLGLRRGLILI